MTAAAEPGGRIESDVVIVGGGLVGLTLGVALAGAGIETVVVDGAAPEAMRDAAFDGRVSSIALGSKRVLDGIGLWPALAGVAEPILEIRVSDGDAPLFLHYDHKAVGAGPLGFIVENRAIRAALGARARRRCRRSAISRRPRSRRWSLPPARPWPGSRTAGACVRALPSPPTAPIPGDPSDELHDQFFVRHWLFPDRLCGRVDNRDGAARRRERRRQIRQTAGRAQWGPACRGHCRPTRQPLGVG